MEKEEILKIRGQLGLTQSQFAAKLQVYPSHVSKWEQGKNKISRKNEDKIWELLRQWEIHGPKGDQLIAGYDPDGTIVFDDEEDARHARRNQLEWELDDLREELRDSSEPDDQLMLEEKIKEFNKAEDMVERIRPDNPKDFTKLNQTALKNWKVYQETGVYANPPFRMTEVKRSVEDYFTDIQKTLSNELESLKSQDFDFNKLWETFGLNPETLSNEQQVEFFDTVFGEAITGVNDVLKKTFEGPQGQAFKEKIRASLDRKAKEFSEQYKMNQQSLIRKSTDRENELTTEIQHLKEKTRLMDKLIERTESSITTLETSLKTSLQNISEINARHENDRNRSEIQIKELSKKLKEVFEYIESSNKFNDEEIEKLKDELKKSSSNVTAKILALS